MPLIFLILLCGLLMPSLAWAQPDSLFDISGKPQDVARHILDFLFTGTSDIFNSEAAGKFQRVLRQLFMYYSGALLVFAVIVVLYHLIVMVAESAHYGIPFGKRNKQMWAPIRLVLALGLLIPIGGFSTAQFLIMQMTRMGSSLASNAWNSFADTIKPTQVTLHGSARVDPTATITHLAAIGACVKAYEITYSGLATERLVPFVVPPFLISKEESGENFSRTTFLAKMGDPALLPVACGNLSWVMPEPDITASTMSRVAARFAKAHLAAIKEIQQGALNLGGSLALGTLGIFNTTEATYALTFAKLVETYQKSFLAALREDKITIDKYGNVAAISDERTTPTDGYGWMMAGVTLQKFALTDTVMLTPELAAPVVTFHYPLFAAVNDKPTLLLARTLSFAHLLLQSHDPAAATKELWFNPTIDHGKGPVKQALTLSASILSRTEANLGGQNMLDPGLAESGANIGLFKPIALAFRALDLADQFWAVADWSPRANSPVFGPAIIFGNLAQAVRAALLTANPRIEAATLGSHNLLDIDQPADSARYLVAAIGLLIFIPALLLVFLLPLIPLLHFALGSVLWLIAVFQGLASAPIWALTFLSLKGDELVPPGSRLGLAIILNIFLRPILMVIGFITALMLMHMGFAILEVSLALFQYDGLQGSKTLFSIGTLILIVIYLLAAFAITNAAMKCISLFPDFTLKWLGGGGASAEEGQAAGAGAAAGAGVSSTGTAQAAVGGGGGAAGNSSQQVWQRKLLGVLEQLSDHFGGSVKSTVQNAGLFAHMAERPDAPAPNTAGADGSTVTASAGTPTNVNVTSNVGGLASSTTVAHVEGGTARKSGRTDASIEEKNSLMAQTIRGNQTDK